MQNYYLGSNHVSTILNLKPPTRVRSDLTPEYLRVRIPELMGCEKHAALCKLFYESCFHHFFSSVGYPIKKLYSSMDGVIHADLQIGDGITIEEVGLYSRIYQRVPNEHGFLIIEQHLDVHSDKDVNIWKTQIKNYPITMEHINENYSSEGLLNLDALKNEDPHLHEHFCKFLDFHKKILIDLFLKYLPIEKAKVIQESNSDTNGMIQALWEDFLKMNK
jgi:hypothetical protein